MFNKFIIVSNKIYRYSNLVHKVSGKNHFIDMLLSRLLLKIPLNLYFDFAFYNKSWNKRQNYLIDDIKYSTKYNCGATQDSAIDKMKVIRITLPYLNRKIQFTKDLSLENFEEFIKGLSSFFYKPNDGCSGVGIEKIQLSDNEDINLLYEKIKSLPEGIIEETVIQHKDLCKLHPSLLQTIRFTVFKHKNGPKILFASIKTSTKQNTIVDNAHGGGIYANINLETGKIQTNAFRSIDKSEDLDNYDIRLFSEQGLPIHPVTGTIFKGFQIPYFNEAKDLVIKISKDVDFFGRRLIGYDIAITDKGPILIEANINVPGMNNVWQTACKDRPLKKVLEDMLKE